ncbi:MAG: hypothetical protein IPI67_24765 [Myxococcales bacterium]|nr:hypothetical protein [Myxococcales bacterium]
MRAVLTALLHSILSFLRSRQAVALEIVALRHQLVAPPVLATSSIRRMIARKSEANKT